MCCCLTTASGSRSRCSPARRFEQRYELGLPRLSRSASLSPSASLPAALEDFWLTPPRGASFSQVIYDISELDEASLQGLRTSLLTALRRFSVPGFRPILIQVCLALADLAVQMLSWSSVVQGLIADFGQDVAMVPALLEFLRVLPEEAGNPKIVVASEEMERRLGEMMGSASQEVLRLLAMYIAAPGASSLSPTSSRRGRRAARARLTRR